MRQVHRAGEKMFTDFSGKKPHWIDPMTGEIQEVELFVAVLGASNYTYAEALESQKVPCWLAGNTRALEYFGGVPELTIPDRQLIRAIRLIHDFAQLKCCLSKFLFCPADVLSNKLGGFGAAGKLR